MKKLLIIGTGDYALVAHHYITTEKLYDVIGFSEERAYIRQEEILGLKNIPFEEIDSFEKSTMILVAIGPNKVNTVRERIYNEVKKKGFNCITYVSPQAIVGDVASIGENSFIFPKCVVEPFAKVGNNTVLWSGATLAHHSEIKDHCFIAPGACISGRTVIKNNCFIGINATVRDNIVVEEKCIIGGGAVIKKNTVAGGVYSAPPTGLYNTDSFDTRV